MHFILRLIFFLYISAIHMWSHYMFPKWRDNWLHVSFCCVWKLKCQCKHCFVSPSCGELGAWSIPDGLHWRGLARWAEILRSRQPHAAEAVSPTEQQIFGALRLFAEQRNSGGQPHLLQVLHGPGATLPEEERQCQTAQDGQGDCREHYGRQRQSVIVAPKCALFACLWPKFRIRCLIQWGGHCDSRWRAVLPQKLKSRFRQCAYYQRCSDPKTPACEGKPNGETIAEAELGPDYSGLWRLRPQLESQFERREWHATAAHSADSKEAPDRPGQAVHGYLLDGNHRWLGDFLSCD